MYVLHRVDKTSLPSHRDLTKAKVNWTKVRFQIKTEEISGNGSSSAYLEYLKINEDEDIHRSDNTDLRLNSFETTRFTASPVYALAH